MGPSREPLHRLFDFCMVSAICFFSSYFPRHDFFNSMYWWRNSRLWFNFTGYCHGCFDNFFGLYLELAREGSAPDTIGFQLALLDLPISFPPEWMACFLHARCIPHRNSIRQLWASVCVRKYVNILCSNFACSALQFSCFHDTLGRLEFSFLHSQFQLSRFMVYSCLCTFVEFMPKSTPRHKMHNGKTSNDAQRHPKTSKDIQTRPNISKHIQACAL
jgi:hypothetical protein